MDTKVYNNSGKEVGKIELPSFFDRKISPSLVYEVVTAHLNNQRAGTHKTKSRGEVSFSGAKPWRQKGTGHARAGQRNSPLWRKGGIIFGPKPRDYSVHLSKQKKRLSLHMAFASQFQNGNIIVIDSLAVDSAKTKKVAAIVKNLGLIDKSVLFAVVPDKTFSLAARNLKDIAVENIRNVNTYQVFKADKIVTTAEALEILKSYPH